ncbi:glycosyltransferase involved in cell wall biosynthesis [Methanofollis sp. W23]|uniref:glycosyltransferase family 2 protein n=1 Tax=Methanofollis sp. W23 TaxID=2817849 RepID=UPI001AE2D8CB|nr:glycosyltransferase family A protein [Methanofollis sp. W23]MBP2144570.1 glycosyltransferase involved in cell wall biosynthesis [Methanofollis sp. W23]
MTDIPAVSVVIPLYNKGPYIARALNSVLAQTFQDFEVIVVDDGSTDEGAEVVRGFDDPRIQLIQQENRGVSAARNRGIEAVRAELVAFLDADDEWSTEHLRTLLRLRDSYPEAGAYGTAYLVKEKDSKVHVASFSDDIPQEPWEGLLPSYFKAATFGDPPISASTVAIPIYILKEMDGFSTEEWMGEDVDLWGRIALKYPITFSWNSKGIYHTEASNRACNRVEPLGEAVFVRIAKKAIDAGKVSPAMLEDLREYIALRQIRRAWGNIHAKRPDIARNLLNNCVTRKFIRKKYWAIFWACMPSNVYKSLRSTKKIFTETMHKAQKNCLNIFKDRRTYKKTE